MLIIQTTGISRDMEELERIRKQIQEQTRQEVVVLPCGCKLIHISGEEVTGKIEAVELNKTV